MQRENQHLPEYQVVVDDVTGGEIANIVKGYIEVKGEKIRFKGIAYGRYGGQNFAPKLSRLAKKKLKEVFGDVSKFEEEPAAEGGEGRLPGRPGGGRGCEEEGRARPPSPQPL